jgi:type I restriction-modification system DNA methylase subunit
MLASLKTTGRGAVVMPHGVLFRGRKEGDIRMALLRAHVIEAIIGLPPKLFYGTGIQAVIIVLNKSIPDRERNHGPLPQNSVKRVKGQPQLTEAEKAQIKKRKALSDDVATLAAIAAKFGVSVGVVKKIRQQLIHTGKMERTPQHRGPRKLTPGA